VLGKVRNNLVHSIQQPDFKFSEYFKIARQGHILGTRAAKRQSERD